MTSIQRFNLGGEPSTMITGYVLEQGRPVLVELVDAADGFVTVAALDGQPFAHPHYGQCDQVTIPANQFKPMFQKLTDRPAEPQPAKRITLLDLALAAAREAWSSGEVCYVWGDRKAGPGQSAYLREKGRDGGGWVNLYIAGYQRGCPIFYLSPTSGWAPLADVTKRYQGWMQRVKSEVVK